MTLHIYTVGGGGTCRIPPLWNVYDPGRGFCSRRRNTSIVAYQIGNESLILFSLSFFLFSFLFSRTDRQETLSELFLPFTSWKLGDFFPIDDPCRKDPSFIPLYSASFPRLNQIQRISFYSLSLSLSDQGKRVQHSVYHLGCPASTLVIPV